MATLISTPTRVPRAHAAPHYLSSYSKPAKGSLSAADRDTMQRLVWKLFFMLVVGVFVVGLVLSSLTD